MPSGEIISQTPAAGTNAPSGSAVAIVVSLGAPASEAVLHSFGSGTDGQYPYSGLVQGTDGNLYGTTGIGGTAGRATLFRITPAGDESVLYQFGNGTDPATVYAGVVLGIDGNLHGTTVGGGTNGDGTIFRLTP